MRIHQAHIFDASTGLNAVGLIGVSRPDDGPVTITLLGGDSFDAGDSLRVGAATEDVRPSVTSASDPWITRRHEDRNAVSILPLHNLAVHTESPECWCCPICFGVGGRELTPANARLAWDDTNRLVVAYHRSEIASQNYFGDIPWMPSATRVSE
ncbi:MAG: hypothetical protein NTX29_09195 [Actinobacteria bacterium]|nr:hypothetical protein [Actinomycetota bacterium]